MGAEREPAVTEDQRENPEQTIPRLDGTSIVEVHHELSVEVAAISDVGCRRANNEDSFGYDLGSQLFVVCDGMGGLAAGEVASGTAVDQLLHFYKSLCAKAVDIEERLHQAITNA